MSSTTRAPRIKNALDVLDAIQRKSPVTQHELVVDTKLSRGTVASIVRRLHEQQLIESARDEPSGLGAEGRSPGPIRLRPNAALALCIDIGNRHVAVAAGGLSGITGEPELRDLPIKNSAADALEVAVELTRKVLANQDPPVSPDQLVGVCVSIAAPIDQRRGQIASALGMNPWIGLRPADELQYRLGRLWSEVPFMLENNANLTALAEFELGVAGSSSLALQDTVIVVTWSDGIGGAVLIDGQLLVGARGLATEFGHTPIHRNAGGAPNGASPCPRCGHFCLQSLAGGQALTERLRKGPKDDLSFEEVIQRAVTGSGEERKLLREAAVHVGEVLGGYISFLNARLVVISGRHFGEAPHNVAAYRTIVDSIRTGMLSTGFPAALEDADIALGERSRYATVEGGIIAALRAELPAFFERRLTMA